jgi:hypothetical protein
VKRGAALKKLMGVGGRFLFILLFGFFMSFFIFESVGDEGFSLTGLPVKLMIMIASFFVMFIGLMVSFKNVKLGGFIIMGGGVFNAIYMILGGGADDIDAALIFGVPFIIIGVMIIASFRKKSKYY